VQLAGITADGDAALRMRVGMRRLNHRQYVGSLECLLELLGEAGEFCLLTSDNHSDQPGRGAVSLKVTAMPPMASFPYTFSSDAGAVNKEVFHEQPLRFDKEK